MAHQHNLRSNLRILQARRAALANPLPSVSPARQPSNHLESSASPGDASHLENHAFYLHNLTSHSHHPDTPHVTKKHTTTLPDSRPTKPNKSAATARVGKTTSKRQRFIANWTPQMDKVIRKALAKHGWGCWTKIALSGKLPQEYTPKMISNRARAIGLSRQSFTRAPPPTSTPSHQPK